MLILLISYYSQTTHFPTHFLFNMYCVMMNNIITELSMHHNVYRHGWSHCDIMLLQIAWKQIAMATTLFQPRWGTNGPLTLGTKKASIWAQGSPSRSWRKNEVLTNCVGNQVLKQLSKQIYFENGTLGSKSSEIRIFSLFKTRVYSHSFVTAYNLYL